MRRFKTEFPNLFYFAYGLGNEYKLVLSKEKFKIGFHSLTKKCKKFFIKYTCLRIDPDINPELLDKLNPYLELDKWFELLTDVLHYVHGEKEFISRHYDVEKQIWDNLKIENVSRMEK